MALLQRPRHWGWGLVAGLLLGVLPGLALLRLFGEGGALAWLLIVVGSGLFGWVRADDALVQPDEGDESE